MSIPSRELIRNRLISIATEPKYKSWKAQDGVTIEYADVPYALVRVYRFTTDMECSLESFRAFITTPKNTGLFDTSAESNVLIFRDQTSAVECLHSRFRAVSVIAARDFCAWSAYDTIAVEDLPPTLNGDALERFRKIVLPRYSGDIVVPTQVFVSASVNSNYVPETPKLVRGEVIAFGYLAFQLTETSIRVVQISCTDPKGNIPSFAMDSVNLEASKKLGRIRDLSIALHNTLHNMDIALPPAPFDFYGKELAASGTNAITEELVVSEAPRKDRSLNSTARSQVARADSNGSFAQRTPSQSQPPTSHEEQKKDTPLHQDPTPANEESQPAEPTAPPAPTSAPPAAATPVKTMETVATAVSAPTEESPAPVVSRSKVEVPPKFVLTPAKKAHLARVLDMHLKGHWTAAKTLENCLLEETIPSFSTIKANRISTTFKCSIETFANFIFDDANLKKYDPQLEKFKVVKELPDIGGSITYSAYRRESRFVSPRDFLVKSAAALLISSADLKTGGFGAGVEKVFVSGSESTEEGLGGLKVDGWVRGKIHVYGFVAIETDTPCQIEVYNIMCVDPCGSLPAVVMDAANALNCKKLALIRKLCEEQEATGGAAPKAKLNTTSLSASPSPKAPPRQGSETPLGASQADGGSIGFRSPSVISHDNDSVASFESCLDEDEVKREVEDLQEFYTSEVSAICNRLTALHKFHGWTYVNTKNDCKIETAQTPLSKYKAVRLTFEINCTMNDFYSIITNVQHSRKYDPDLDSLEVLESPPYGSVVYSSYKSPMKGVSPRDFCTISVSKFLTEQEGSDLSLYTPGIHSAAFLVNAIDCDDVLPKAGLVRGSVFCHGYIAIATPPTAKRIRVYHLALVDPMGDIPKKLADATVINLSDKAAAIRKLCESFAKGEILTMHKGSGAAPDIDDSMVLKPYLKQHVSHWSSQIQVGRCLVDMQPHAVNKAVTIVRASMEFLCTIETFENILSNTESRRKYDTDIDTLKFLGGPSNASVSICSFKPTKKLSCANAAFCEVTVGRFLSSQELESFHLVTSGMKAAAYLQNSSNWDPNTLSAFLATTEGLIGGQVLTNGFMGVALPPAAQRIRVTHQWCVTLGKNYTEKKRVISHIQQEVGNRLVRLAALCQSHESSKNMAYFAEEEQLEAKMVTSMSGTMTPANMSGLSPEATMRQGMTPEHSTPSQAAAKSPIAEPIDPQPTPVVTQSTAPAEVKSEPASPQAVAVQPKVVVPKAVPLSQQPLFSKLIDLTQRDDWKKISVTDNCVVETCSVDYSTFSAVRILTQFQCSLKTYDAFMSDESKMRLYDPGLHTFETLKKTKESVILYSSYKRESRLVAPRDFLTETAKVTLTPEEGVAQNLCRKADSQGVYVCTTVSTKFPGKGDVSGWVRGNIIAFGYVIHSEEPGVLKVAQYMLVDPNGSIPKWIIEATNGLNAKKLALIRKLCEEEQVKNPM